MHSPLWRTDKQTIFLERGEGAGRKALSWRGDFRSWKKLPLANLTHLVWDAWQLCQSLRADTVTKEIFKGKETLLIPIIHSVSSLRLLRMRFKFFLEIRFWKGVNRRQAGELSFGAPKENVSCFFPVPYTVKRSIRFQFSSVAQLCPTLCDPMDCSMPVFPVHHQLPELTQTHVHWVGDAIQPSYPLSSPSPPAFNLSQHQGLFKWVIWTLSNQMPAVIHNAWDRPLVSYFSPGGRIFPSYSLISSETWKFCGQDTKIIWDQITMPKAYSLIRE